MTLADFYLLCFLVGFLLSVFAVLSGSFHMHAHGLHHGDFHFHAGGGHDVPHAGGTGEAHAGSSEVSMFNFGTLAAFLAWFGGTGYILERWSSVWFLFGLGLAFISGLGGAALIFVFLAKVLVSREESLNPADYDMVGVLGHISSPVRAGGTGELVYSQGGTRRVCGVRGEEGEALAKGVEVVVTRYEKGIAYVRRWDELTGGTATGQRQAAG